MKKLLLFELLMIGVVMNSWAFRTTITSSIHADSIESVSNAPSGNISTNVMRVRFINHATSMPELETAMTTASYIFTNAMQNEGINLTDITAEVLLEDLGNDSNILCKVDVIYTDTIYSVSDLHQIGLYLDETHPVLIPLAMSDQTRRENNGLAMRIKLRPNVPYHCDITPAPDGKFDATTILLRALAMGCGIQSTFNPNTLSVGITEGGTTYINAFDAQIYNEDNATLVNVLDGHLSMNTFLSGKALYADGWYNSGGTDVRPTYLFNELEYGFNVSASDLTMNTVNPLNYTEDEIEEDFVDIMDAYIPRNASIREMTPYTMALLRKLGWFHTIPVGPGDPFQGLYSSHLLCSNKILSPNVSYSLSTDNNNVYIEGNSIIGELNSTDSVYVFGSSNSYPSTFSYSNIPQNVQWKRNPITKNIVGQIRANVGMYVDDYQTQRKVCDIEIPYKPNRPIVHKSETSNSSNINLNLSAFANGSSTYTISYTGLTYSDYHTMTVTANAIDTILQIPATQYYDVAIYGTNASGNSDIYYFTIGSSIQPEIVLNLSVSGNTLRYYLNSNNATYLPNTQIGNIVITNTNGIVYLTPQASPGDAINISSLPRGFYLFSVVINGETYSKMFLKR